MPLFICIVSEVASDLPQVLQYVPVNGKVGPDLRRVIWSAIVQNGWFPSIRAGLDPHQLDHVEFSSLLILRDGMTILWDTMEVITLQNRRIVVSLCPRYVILKPVDAAEVVMTIVPLIDAAETAADFATRIFQFVPLVTSRMVTGDHQEYNRLEIYRQFSPTRFVPIEAHAYMQEFHDGAVVFFAVKNVHADGLQWDDLLHTLTFPAVDLHPITCGPADVAERSQQEAFKLCAKPSLSSDELDTLERLLTQNPQLVHHQQLAIQGDPDSMTTLLYTAARDKNVRAVILLCQKNGNPNLRVDNVSKSTPMHVACYRGYEGVVRAMLEHSRFPYDINLRNAFNERCIDVFHETVSHQTQQAIRRLVANGAVNGGNQNGGVAPPQLWFVPAAHGNTWELVDPRTQHLLTLGVEEGENEVIVRPMGRADDVTYDLRGLEFTALAVEENGRHDLMRMACDWFYVGNEAQLLPLPPEERWAVLQALHSAAGNPPPPFYTHGHTDPEIGDFSRLYDLHELYSANTVTNRKRPLLHMKADGFAEIGDCNAQWVLRLVQGGSDIILPQAAAKDLELFLNHTTDSIHVSTDPAGRDRNARLDVEIFIGAGVADGDFVSYPALYWPTATSRPVHVRAVRYIPMAFHLAYEYPQTVLRPFLPQLMRALMFALAAGHRQMRDKLFEYDLVRRTMRPLMYEGPPMPILLGRPRDLGNVLESVNVPQVLGESGVARLQFLLQPTNREVPRTTRTVDERRWALVMRCMRTLLQMNCVLVGGAVADVVVHGSLPDNPPRFVVEAEMPLTVHVQNYNLWITQLMEELRGFVVGGVNGQLRFAETVDPISGVATHNGQLSVDVSTDVTLCLVPAWNAAESPKRTLDFTVNNLRLEKRAEATPPYRLLQSVPVGLTTADLILRIIGRITSPIMGVEWRGNEPVVRPDTPPYWRTRIEQRMASLRLQGYRLEPHDIHKWNRME